MIVREKGEKCEIEGEKQMRDENHLLQLGKCQCNPGDALINLSVPHHLH